MSLKLLHTDPNLTQALRNGQRPERLGNILVDKGILDPGDLLKALTLQQFEELRIGEMLTGLGFAKKDTVLHALAEQLDLPVVDLSKAPPQAYLQDLLPAALGLKIGAVLWKKDGETLIVALHDPSVRPAITEVLADKCEAVAFVMASRDQINNAYQNLRQTELSLQANTDYPPDTSIRAWSGRKPAFIGVGLVVAMTSLIYAFPTQSVNALLGWTMLVLLANSSFKLACLIGFFCRKAPNGTKDGPLQRPRKLPKVSILVPVLRENDVIDQLVARMSALQYPKELLEICLVYEADDLESRNHIQSRALPRWMHAIEVPNSNIQTKPRAMNYALDFLRGDIVGIFDAEDAPEPDQIYQVLSRFEEGGEKTACVQCQLDFFNSRTNWISRCFTIEYAILFRVILPGMERLSLPIPLGGTSVYFRREVLEKLGRWDAHNVTEDADLGMRLARSGYHCLIAPSTTFEEANFRAIPWIKQRSRWLKGFLQTWIAHMKRPIALAKSLGLQGFLTFQVLFLGTFTSFAAAPLVLPLWGLSIGLDLPLYQDVSGPYLDIMVRLFLFTEALLLGLGAVAVLHRGSRELLMYLPCMLLYWPLGCFAAYKAFYELFARPVYWDKTMHGINDAEYQTEIERLTGLPSSDNPR